MRLRRFHRHRYRPWSKPGTLTIGGKQMQIRRCVHKRCNHYQLRRTP